MTSFCAEHEDLLAAVDWALRAVASNPLLPILSGLLIDVGEDGEVAVTGFDTTTAAVARFKAQETVPGRLVLPGKLLQQILKTLPKNSTVDLEMNDASTVGLNAGGAGFTVQVMPVEDYPALPIPPAECGTVDAAELRTALQAVEYATGSATEVNGLRMDAMRLEAEGDQLTVVATDRHRVPVATLRWQPDEGMTGAETLVHPAALYGFAKQARGAVRLALPVGDAGLVQMSCEGRSLLTSVCAGTFPNWRRALEMAGKALSVRVNREELRQAVSRAEVVAERNHPIRLTFMEGSIQVDGGLYSTMSEVVGAEVVGGEAVCHFSPLYLLKALEVAPADEVSMKLAESAPAMFSASGEGVEYRQLVMPQRAPSTS